MGKSQVHEIFKTFSADTFEKAATLAELFAETVNAKSLAAVRLGPLTYISLGYQPNDISDVQPEIEIVKVALELPTTIDIDTQITDAVQNIAGEVICHAIFIDDGLQLALLLQV